MPEKQKFPIVLAVLIPVVMIALVAASVYLPRLYAHPQYDFLYYSKGCYYCDVYAVSDGTIKTKPVDPENNYCDCPKDSKFYVYNAATGKSKEITLEAARRLTLDPARISPDGFTVADPGNGGDFYPFYSGSNDYDSKYLKGNGATFRVELPDGVAEYYFVFLGWVEK